MRPQAFQAGEVRDEHDNIIRQGAYGKKTPFATADNSGILDYIINNFDALNALLNIVKGGIKISGVYTSLQELQAAHPSGNTGDAYMVGMDLYTWVNNKWTNLGNLQGPKGDDGTGLSIKGKYDSLQALKDAHPTGENGDAYMVGVNLYVWTGASWTDCGSIQGPAGERGQNGKDGVSIAHSWSGTTLSVTSASGTSSANLVGPRGKQGVAGKNGTSVTHQWSGSVLKITSASGTSQADLRGPKGDKGDPGAVINNGDVYTNRANIFTVANTFNGSVLNSYNVTNGGKIEADVAKIIASYNAAITINPITVFGLAQSLTAKCCLVIIEGVGAPVINWQGCKMCIEAPTKTANKTTIVTFLIDDYNAYLVSANYEV